VHVDAARAVVDAGCPFVVFIEGAVAGEPDRLHRVRTGIGLLALRLAEVPIVPMALAGSDDLYRGKRIAVRFLAPVTARELAGSEWPTMPPPPGSREEIRLARLLTDRLGERLQGAITELYPGTVDPPARARRWRWLRRLF
jgi:1-acyl-sn-glycerol-3-phosphate acyltransferase